MHRAAAAMVAVFILAVAAPASLAAAAAASPAAAAASPAAPAGRYSASPTAARPAATPILHKPDFNGDGFADLAISSLWATVDGVPRAGAVNVLYGSLSGLGTAGNQVWSQNSPDILDHAEKGDSFGASLATADFNGDGYSDLAVGVRFESVVQEGVTIHGAGAVNVIYGSAVGLTSTGNQFWSQDSPGILGLAEKKDQFGRNITAADFNGDGYEDLAVGVTWEDIASTDDGAVNVIYGSAAGLTSSGNQFWNQDSPGIPDQAEAHDQFGRGLAAGDFNHDGYADLAVSAPYESYDAVRDGLVHVIYGSATGLTATGSQLWSQDSKGILDHAALREEFGLSLATGDFNHDGYDDLTVGVWFEDLFNAYDNSGAMNVIYGSSKGLAPAGNQFWTQDSPGILNQANQGDQWSQAMGVADYNGDGFDDIAVASPWEDFGKDIFADRGGVNVIFGTAAGLTATGNQFWSQDSPGIPDQAEDNDMFGEALGGADFNGDGRDDLAVSTPYENHSNHPDAGLVEIIPGTGAGLTATGAQKFSAGTPGMLGSGAETSAIFGWSVSGSHPAAVTSRLCDAKCSN